jgi:hypothetical protein
VWQGITPKCNNFMKYIFYCIYNTQYLDGKNKVNKTPWFDALGLMIAGSLCWLFIIVEILYFYVFNQNFPSISKVGIAVVCISLFYIHYVAFIKDRKYEHIYEQYQSIDRKKGIEKLIGVSYIFVPALLSMLIALIWHKVI